jgi:hypothetical protein
MIQSFFSYHELWSDESPEPTAVGACSSAVAAEVASRRRPSLLRLLPA